MANSKILCLAIHCIILLLSVEVMMKIRSVDAKECLEGLDVLPTCRGQEADQGCWIECQRKHGPKAEAWCRSILPGYPGQVCMCSYPC